MTLRVGIQLYSVRQTLQKEPLETLAKVADVGYRFVEGANHHADHDPGLGLQVPADQLRRQLEDIDLQIVGCHINPLKQEALGPVLEYQQTLGNSQIGCDIEFYPYLDRDYLLRRCDVFNEMGEMCRRQGMRFYYHNHYQEFQRFGDELVFDIIMAATDPALVFLELDTYWVTRAGQNPLEIMEKYNDRLLLLHQKDFPKQAPQPVNMYEGLVDPEANIDLQVFLDTKDPRCFVEIGHGILPIQDIIHQANQAPNLQFLLLEQDFTELDEIQSISVSRQALADYDGVEG